MEDSKIIELFWNRDEQAIKEIEIKYGKLCKHTANNILTNPLDADEVVNEVYLGLWDSIPPKRPQHLKAFICKMTRNIATTKYKYINAEKRKSQYQVALEELGEILSGSEDVEQIYQSKEICRYINEYLTNISQEKRVMFIKRYWFSDSVIDIAKAMGIGESKVKTTLLRIRKDLKKHLERKGVEL